MLYQECSATGSVTQSQIAMCSSYYYRSISNNVAMIYVDNLDLAKLIGTYVELLD